MTEDLLNGKDARVDLYLWFTSRSIAPLYLLNVAVV